MPRITADVYGSFNRGRAGGHASRGDYEGAERAAALVDPELAGAYGALGDRSRARSREQEADSANRTYADAIVRNDFGAAESVAAKVGNVEGVMGARTAQTQATLQQRLEGGRGLQRYGAEMEALEGTENPQAGYDALLARAIQESAASPELVAELQRLPRDYETARRVVPNVIREWRNRLLTPDQAARLEAGGGERRYTPASGGILDTFTGNVNRNPHYVRGGAAEGPPAPPAGYRIVE